jgi:hypothetical protein
MYTLSQITMPHLTVAKIKDYESAGAARLAMNALKAANKSGLYCVHKGHHLISSMLNK